jgi:hypothetical protein
MSDPSPFEYLQHGDMLTITNASDGPMHLQNIVMDGADWRSDDIYIDELNGGEMWLEDGASYEFTIGSHHQGEVVELRIEWMDDTNDFQSHTDYLALE